MTRYKIVNGEKIEFTAEEEAIRDQQEADFEAGRFNRSMANLREKRNSLLAETDYLALSDNTISDEMKNYRQELRDITDGLTTDEEVKAVVFPTKPN